MAVNQDKQIQYTNVAIKDEDEQTLLLRLVEKLSQETKDPWIASNKAFVNSVLSKHIKFENHSNPANKYGLSHYHVACMSNHAEVVEFFLKNKVFVDQIVDNNSSIAPGYSPLHFTARCTSLESTGILLQYGADMHVKDARGMIPMHILLEQRIKMFYSVRKRNDEAILKKIEDNERIINMLLENDSTNDSPDHLGLLNFHVACTLKDYSIAEKLSDQVLDINQCVNNDSPVYPGYTALHFAMRCQMDTTAKMLVMKGANLLIQDAKGVTPLDIFLKFSNSQQTGTDVKKGLQTFLTSVPAWKNIHFSDGKTMLLDFISALENFEKFKAKSYKSVNIYLPEDSPIWPGSTLLHLAVILSANRYIIDKLLELGADYTDQDNHDSSPLHLAFRQNKLDIVELMLNYRYENIANPIDKDNLSHLHIACAMGKGSLVKKMFLLKNINCNITYRGPALVMIKPGWTPLHTASASGESIIVKLLLKKGANLVQPDYQGFTAIHWLLGDTGTRRKKQIANILLATKKWKDCEVEGIGLNYLHVACWNKNLIAVNRCLKEGSNIEAVIGPIDNETLGEFVGCRPLNIAMMKDTRVSKVLLDHGADILARQPNGDSPLSQVLDGTFSSYYLDMFVSHISSNKILQTRMQEDLGVSMLHVACRTLDIDKVKELLEIGVGANVKVRDDSNFWAGYTPLHVLVKHGYDAQCQRKIFDLLIQAKADVTLTNADGDTPIHLTLKKYPTNKAYEQTSYLIQHQRDLTVNHTNKEGASHFHAACLVNDLDAVKKFLQNGRIDVNKPISSSANQLTGCTPLQLALDPRSRDVERQIQMWELLLKYGAKALHTSRYGDTALHIAAKSGSSCKNLVQLLIDSGVDIHAETTNGQTAFEILLSSDAEVSLEVLKLFVDLGCSVNDCNRQTGVGYLSIIYSNAKFTKLDNKLWEWILDMPDICTLNKLRRNAIHNILTTELDYCRLPRLYKEDQYGDLIEKLIKLGCDIDQQDICGKTPLFISAEFKNTVAIRTLLQCGADINIPNFNGESVFNYAFANIGPIVKLRSASCGFPYFQCKYRILVDHLAEYLKRLQYLGLDLNPLDENTIVSAYSVINRRYIEETDLVNEIEEAKNLSITKSGLTLHDFLSEYRAVISYRYLGEEKRNIIDAFFKTIDYQKFFYLRGIIKLQYKKAVARFSLLEDAEISLSKLLRLPMPAVCAHIILRFLKYSELTNLIAATRERR